MRMSTENASTITPSSPPQPLNLKKVVFYGFTSITGTAFYFFGLFTFLNILQRFLAFPIPSGSEFTVIVLESLFFCFVVVNLFMGYGLVNRRRWVLSISLISLILLSGLGIVRYFGIFLPQYSRMSVFIPTAAFAVISTVLFLNRKYLDNRYINIKILVPFSIFLLIAVVFSNVISRTL